ncbi:hypothetical protein [Nostoc sp. 2RC]|uniref:hypothetical protein n=1 Tax=Nostoc sp. 2RC TaxID=2485484 RepID=UPI001623507B|nr:hypothetical protein [Nostoc sp. 2RC]MBC1239133.1 hypothetical protein [Nostoc sp. 2RC]
MKQREENQGKQQRTPGIPCPECGFFIEMSIYSLLSQADFKCPGCLLTLSMDREVSRPALELLQKVNTQMDNLEKHKRFDI